MLSKDRHYHLKIKTFVPDMKTLLHRGSKTDNTGTDLLLFQLSSFLAQLAFKDKHVGAELKDKNPDLLDECVEEYRHNHGQQYCMRVGARGGAMDNWRWMLIVCGCISIARVVYCECDRFLAISFLLPSRRHGVKVCISGRSYW